MDVPTKDNARAQCMRWLNSLGVNVQPQNLVVDQISGGITNILYHVYLVRSSSTTFKGGVRGCLEDFRKNGVGVRFYGKCLKCLVVDREEERQVTKAAGGLCKLTHFAFRGGQVDEWITGRHVTYAECLVPPVYTAIATHMAKFHAVDYASAGSNNHLCERLEKWVIYLRDSGFRDFTEDLDKFKKIYHTAQKSPWAREVLCHNDLLNGNIVRSNHKSERATVVDNIAIEFIDYEYASVGLNAYDVANHLVETANDSGDYERIHEQDYVIKFLLIYLEAFNAQITAAAEDEHTSSLSTCYPNTDTDDESLSITDEQPPAPKRSEPTPVLPVTDIGDFRIVASSVETTADTRVTTTTSVTITSTTPPAAAPRKLAKYDLTDQNNAAQEFSDLVVYCAPLSHLYWSVWALVQYTNGVDVSYDFRKFSDDRFRQWAAAAL